MISPRGILDRCPTAIPPTCFTPVFTFDRVEAPRANPSVNSVSSKRPQSCYVNDEEGEEEEGARAFENPPSRRTVFQDVGFCRIPPYTPYDALKRTEE